MIIATIFLLILALLPSLFWLLFYLRKDYLEPEPRKLLIKIFILGVVLAVPVTYVAEGLAAQYLFTAPESNSQAIWFSLILSFGLVAPIEEFVKYWIAKTIVQRNKRHFTQVVDGIIYMVVAAAAFAFVENFKYFYENVVNSVTLGLSYELLLSNLISTLGLRAIASTLLHLATSGIIGYFWGVSWFKQTDQERSKPFFIGFIAAVAIHGLFNFSIDLTSITNFEFGLIPLIIAIVGTGFLFYRFRNKENLLIHSAPGDEGIDTKQEKPNSATLVIITIILLLAAGFGILVHWLNSGGNGENSQYYYSVVALSDTLAIVTQTEDLQQCNIISTEDIDAYRSSFGSTQVSSMSCDGSIETNQKLSYLFKDESASRPYLSFSDLKGHEKRIIIISNELTLQQHEEALSYIKDIIEQSGFINVKTIYSLQGN